jgi:GR25 family glycosyltransferase involved in LPS biosynthesis
MVYEYFDKIVCINLKERPEKKEWISTLAQQHSIPIEFYEVERHPEGGMVGCFESHLNVIQSCYQDQLKNVLIFEDDFSPTPSFQEESLKEVIAFLEKNPTYEYFQLGYTIIPTEIPAYLTAQNLGPGILEYNGNTTHAYILTRPGMKRVLQTYSDYFKKLDLDLYYKEIFQGRGASVCPLLFDQNFCLESDNLQATSGYYSFLRSISCSTYQYSVVYGISLFRYYFWWGVVLFFLSLWLFLFFFLVLPSFRKAGLFSSKIATTTSRSRKK